MLALVIGTIAPASAQDAFPTWATNPQPVARKALIIGIDKYDHATQLVTTSSDVTGMQSALRNLHFDDVATLYTGGSVSRSDMIAKVKAFAANLRTGDMAFIYFSGHGTELKGVNYLVPSPAIAQPEFPGSEWLSVEWMLSEISKNTPGVIVLVLDACRANPFVNTNVEWRDILDPKLPPPAPSGQSDTDGLAPTPMPTDIAMVVAYAAGYKQVAYSRFKDDPSGVESIYTRTFLQRMPTFLFLGDALSRTESFVPYLTEKRQVPVTLMHAARNVQLDGTKPEAAIVEEFWRLAVDTQPMGKQVEELIGFIGANPTSGYAPLARARLDQIKNGLVQDAPPKNLVAPLQSDAPPPPDNYQLVMGSLQAGTSIQGSAILNEPLLLRAKRNAGSKLANLKAGAMVQLLQIKGQFAKVLSADGLTGWISGTGVVDTKQVSKTVDLGFTGPDEYAAVQNWQPLIDAAKDLAGKNVGVTVRVGTPEVEGDEYRSYVARLRSLRIRDYVVKLGALPTNVVTVLADPGLTANTASVTIGGIAK